MCAKKKASSRMIAKCVLLLLVLRLITNWYMTKYVGQFIDFDCFRFSIT